MALDLNDAVWRKSSRSSGNGNCVEVATLDEVIAVRDSKDPDGPRLAFGPAQWRTFAAQVKAANSKA